MSTNHQDDRVVAANELAELVAEARRGDRTAFDELVRRTYVDTYTLAVRLTGNEEDARDVVQEAYLRAWKGIRRFRGDAAFTTWMYRITANASYTLVDRRRRRRTTRLDDVDDPIDRRLDAQPDTLAESSAGLGELSAALDQLPPTLRTLVILKDVYGLPHDAIADELGISVAAAKVRLHRGRKRLRDILDEREGRDGRSARAV
jgi:RNA polymerase sigma-70 factor (ECF subfamily)